MASATANGGRLQFWVGDVAGNVWLDDVQLSQQPALVYRRDYTNGVVLLNGTSSPETIVLESGLSRFTGGQAPLYQYLVDDSDSAFSSTGSWNVMTYNTGAYSGAGSSATLPAEPQNANGPYYHCWEGACHELDSGPASAQWNLNITADGEYTIQVWLPAAPGAANWTKSAVYEVVSGGATIATYTLDQSTASAGDGVHALGTLTLAAAGAPFLRVHNGGSGPLLADAVYITSTARYNDGSVASQVTLAPYDGILLVRATPVAPVAVAVQTVPAGLQFTIETGAPQTAPQTVMLAPGPHTIAVSAAQPGAAGTRYTFSSWSDGGAASHSITVGSSPATYVATFQTQYQLTISASPAADGTVTPASGAFYNAGNNVPIAATAAGGFQFSNWTGAVANSTGASTTVTMSAPETVTANFAIPTFTLGTSSANIGPAGGTGSVTLNASIATSTWTAVSNNPSLLTITAGASGTGSGTVTYSVAFNNTPTVRTGTLTIAGLTFTVTQAAGTAGLGFVPVTPCRVVDTRTGQGKSGAYGPPALAAGTSRDISIVAGGCNIPATAQAFALNITVAPPGVVSYLTIWPTGLAQPLVSTLNSLNGAVLANAAIVPAGTGGGVSVFVTDATDLIIDIDGYFAPAASALAFYPVTPCRVADTRNANGPFGGPSLAAGGTRSFTVPQSSCGIAATAQAYSLNMTAVPPGPLEYLSTWPTGQTQPVVSTLNALQGQIAANAAIVPAGTNGAVSVFASNTSNVVIDINGYFAPPGSPGALYFYPRTPCRIADTRNATGTFGGPSLGAGSTRSFPIPSSSCSVPAAAQAYSLNMTVVPPGSLLYLSTWPAGQTQPVVSTLNDLQGQIVANAAIIPAGTSGGISVYVSDATNLVIDINGYFGQ